MNKEDHRTIKEAVFEVLKNPETIGSADMPDDEDDSYWNDEPEEEVEETDAERNNRKLHEALIVAAAMASVPHRKGRVQAQFTKKRAKKLSGKERRKRAKQSRNSKKR